MCACRGMHGRIDGWVAGTGTAAVCRPTLGGTHRVCWSWEVGPEGLGPCHGGELCYGAVVGPIDQGVVLLTAAWLWCESRLSYLGCAGVLGAFPVFAGLLGCGSTDLMPGHGKVWRRGAGM